MIAEERDAKVFLERLLEEGIKPHVDTLVPIMVAGGIAVLVFESLAAPEALGALGYDGSSPAFRLSPKAKNRLRRTDHVTRRWLERSGPGRLLAVTGYGTLLVNFTEGEGWSIEPGSLGGSALD